MLNGWPVFIYGHIVVNLPGHEKKTPSRDGVFAINVYVAIAQEEAIACIPFMAARSS